MQTLPEYLTLDSCDITVITDTSHSIAFIV